MLNTVPRECVLDRVVSISTVFMVSFNHAPNRFGFNCSCSVLIMCDVSQKENVVVFQLVAYMGEPLNENIQSLRRVEVIIHRYIYTNCFWSDFYRLMHNQGSIDYLSLEFDESNTSMLKAP